MWSFLVACPRVATWLRTKFNFRWVGQPFRDLFPSVFPEAWCLRELETPPKEQGCGTSLLGSAQVVFSTISWSMYCVCRVLWV
jgi:hypothetical protein